MNGDKEVLNANALILSLPFTPTEHKLLFWFMRDAADPKAAALYVLQRASRDTGNGKDAEFELRHLLTDWKQLVRRFMSPTKISTATRTLVSARDNDCCYITKRSRKWWDLFGHTRNVAVTIVPAEVVEGLDDAAYASLRELLTVFITEDQVRRLMDCFDSHSNDANPLINTFTLEQNVATAFRNGRVKIQPHQYSSKIPDTITTCRFAIETVMPRPFVELLRNGKPLGNDEGIIVTTNDPKTMPLPSAFLFTVRAHFCRSMRLLGIEDQVQIGWPRDTIWHKCQVASRKMIHQTIPVFRRLWLYFPKAIRLFAYRLLLKVGLRIYGAQLPWVQRVPFGLYIKHRRSDFAIDGEAPALRIIEQYTDAPAPRLIDELTSDGHTYLVMTRVPGVPLDAMLHSMTYPERSQLAIDLRSFISKLRQIPNTNAAAICSANGGRIFDYRLPVRGKSAGPFQSEADFNKFLINKEQLKSAMHERSHNIYFTHADLSQTNILVSAGKFSGVVDFGCAGFYPEYWEYTKGYYGHFGPDNSWIDILAESFSNSYVEALEAELKLWTAVTPW